MLCGEAPPTERAYLKTSTLAENPEDDELVLLVEGYAVELVEVLVFDEFQLNVSNLVTLCGARNPYFLEPRQVRFREANVPRLLVAFVGAADAVCYRLLSAEARVRRHRAGAVTACGHASDEGLAFAFFLLRFRGHSQSNEDLLTPDRSRTCSLGMRQFMS